MKTNDVREMVKGYGSHKNINGDRNCCAVLSLAASFELPYDVAYEFASRVWRRRPRKGVYMAMICSTFNDLQNDAATLFNKTVKEVSARMGYVNYGRTVIRKMTLETFIKQYPEGCYFIIVKGHALVVKDGVVLDSSIVKMKRRVEWAFQINNTTK